MKKEKLKTKLAALEEQFFTIAPTLGSRPGKAKKIEAVALVRFGPIKISRKVAKYGE